MWPLLYINLDTEDHYTGTYVLAVLVEKYQPFERNIPYQTSLSIQRIEPFDNRYFLNFSKNKWNKKAKYCIK